MASLSTIIFFQLQIGVVNGSEEYKLGVLMNADMKSKTFQNNLQFFN